MKLLILRDSKIDEFMLPERIEGNYWVHYIDKRGKKKEDALHPTALSATDILFW